MLGNISFLTLNMGFLYVTVGIEVGSTPKSLLALIAKPGSWTISDDRTTVSFILQDDIISNVKADDATKVITMTYDDFRFGFCRFQHANHLWVHFGKSHCCTFMMYIAQVEHEDFDVYEFHDDEIMSFVQLKNEYIKTGRLPVGSNLKFQPNCCS